MGNIFREVLVKRISRWSEGEGAPAYDGKKLPLTHFKVWCDDGIPREITTEAWHPDSSASQTADSIIDYAQEHVLSYHQKGFAPRYYLHAHFGGQDHRTHEYNLTVTLPPAEGENALLATGGLMDMRSPRAQDGRTMDTMLQLVKIHADKSAHDSNLAITAYERINERLFNEVYEQRNEMRTMRTELNAALDQALDREIKRDKAALMLKVQAAVAEQGIAALPAFMGFGHRMLNAKLGVKEDAPLGEELDGLLGMLMGAPEGELLPMLQKAFPDPQQQQKALLLFQRYKARKAAQALDHKAIAAGDGVSRPVPLAKFIQRATQRQVPMAPAARPSPFRKVQ